jgi:hypothetical protein
MTGNIGTMLSHNTRNPGRRARLILYNAPVPPYVRSMMKTTLYIAVLTLGFGAAQPADAACFADYKAKKANPLQLHYGVIELPASACSNQANARKIIQKRISVGGWTLLNVMSVFGPEGLKQRQASAGNYYLQF